MENAHNEWDAWQEEFLRQRKDISDSTLSSYQSDLRQLCAFLSVAGPRRGPRALTRGDIDAYVCQMEAEGRSPATMRRRLVVAGAFFRYLETKGVLAGNPVPEMTLPKPAPAAPETLNRNELRRFLSAPGSDTPKALRDTAMLALLYVAGLQAGEIISLTLPDVNLAKKNMTVAGGEGSRPAPLTADATQSLARYLEEGRPFLTEEASNLVFVNYGGGSLSRQGLWKIVRQYAWQAGAGVNITPRLLRNSFAAHLAEDGVALEAIQRMMGRASSASTRKYVRNRNP